MLSRASHQLAQDCATLTDKIADCLRQHNTVCIQLNDSTMVRWAHYGANTSRTLFSNDDNGRRILLLSTIYDRKGAILAEEYANGSILFNGHIFNETFSTVTSWTYTSGKHNISCRMERYTRFNGHDLAEYEEDALHALANNAATIQALMAA